MTRRLFLALPAVALFALTAGAADENPIVTLVKSKVKDKTKPFAMTVTFKVKAGGEKAFEAAFAPCLKATRKEPGNRVYQLNRDLDEARVYTMYEQFKDVAAVEEHAKAKYVEALLMAIGPLLDGDPKVKVYEVVE